MTTTDLDAMLLIAQAPDGIIFADADGNVAFWNEAAARIFGHTPAEAMGQNLDMIIPEKFRDAHWRGFEHAMDSGETKYGGKALATKALHRDGSEIYVELSFSIVRNAEDAAIGALAHARDITERFNADREMRRRLRELEQEREAKAAGA